MQFGVCEICGLAQLPDELSCLMIPLNTANTQYFTLFYCSHNPQCHQQAMCQLASKEKEFQ